ncbi:LPD1 domain-containing protein [Treponema putidum]|uniref:LPD1 domain-containing protein n=1 Tax=Treponema putidum TaxID=221027 RepID=UPI003D934E4C
MQITVNKEAGFRMLKSINGFLQADSADEFFIQKAIGHKYLRKIPKKSGKGYWYIYTETFKKPLQFLQQVFNISKERINKEFEENNIEKEYGVDKQIYSAHVLEYLTNKLKWDNLFSKNEKRDQYKKAVNTKRTKATQIEKTDDNGKKQNPVEKDKGDKIVVNRTLMYKVWSLYNKKLTDSGGEPPNDGYPEKDYPEYKGKGQEAVDFIVKQKGGQVRGAFNRPDIGDIDVVWGKITDKEKHTGYGLSHIIDKHGMDAARVIGEVIKYGKVVNPTQGRTSIQLGYWKVALKQQFNGNKKIWIVTSFKNEDRGQITTPSPQSDYTKGTNSETSTTIIPQSEEKNNSLSEAMKGNQNAKKDFAEAEKKRKVQNEKRKAAGFPQTELFERESTIKDSTWDPNSEEYRYKDTGYIAGSRKELAHSYIKRMAKEKHQVMEWNIDWEGLEENPRLAKQLIAKSNIFGSVDWDSLKAGGMTGGAAFLIDRVYSMIGKEPAEDSPEARRAYVIGVNGLRDRLERVKTVQDVENTLIEIGEEMAGRFHSVRDTDEYKEKAKKISELRQKVEELRDKDRKLFKACDREEYAARSRANERIRKYLADKKVIRWNQKWWGDKELDKLNTVEKAKFREFQDRVKKEEFAKHDELFAAHRKFQEENGYIRSIEERKYVYPNGHWRYIDFPIEKDLLDAEQNLETWEKIHGEAAMLENPLYKAWHQLGDKFAVITQHSYRNKTFYQHKADARRGNYDNWEWLKKDTVEVSKKGRERKANFEFIVAKEFNRKGGRNVTAKSTQELKELFNLRDVQSGNWVLKDPESAKWHVDRMTEAFADLCDVTGIPDNLVSLNGRLAIAIGARGTGGEGAAQAHYEPIQRVINITKMKGGGSLAHEWFHAFDNLISEAMQGGNVNKFLTNPYKDMSKKKADLLKEYMEIKNNSTIRPSAKELSLFVLKRKLDKEGIKLPEEGSGEEYMLKVHTAFDKLVSTMMEGNEPVIHNVFYSADDYRFAQYNLEEPKGDFAKRIKSAGSLEKATEIINQRFGESTDKKIIKNKSNWIKITAAYYDGKENGGVAEVDSGVRKSRFYAAAVQLDSKKGKEYWAAPHEMAARAFSAYIDDKLREQGRVNDYLAFATTNDFYNDPVLGNTYPYPEGEERERINTAFKELFDIVKSTGAIRKALKFKPEKGVKYVLLAKSYWRHI